MAEAKEDLEVKDDDTPENEDGKTGKESEDLSLLQDVEIDLGEKDEGGKEAGEVKEPENKNKEPEPTPKEKELSERLARVESDKRDLKRALHEARQEKKKSKDPEVTLTDAELMKIVEEHKDDPKVMFNAVTYKIQQLMKSGKTDAVNEVEIKSKQKDLQNILHERIKDFDDESSEPRTMINRAKGDFNLEDHPFGDFLGAAAAVYIDLPNIAKNWFEEGKKAGLNAKADDNRKKGIKESQLTPGGSKLLSGGKTSGELTPSQMETAKRLGLTTPEKLRIYKSQILRESATNA